jgi:hypothetical protein
MNNANNSSAPGLGTTLPNGRKPSTPTTEADYLTQQAVEAKAAIKATAREMGAGVEHAASEHPLLAIGLAAVTGALVARVVSPHVHHGHNGESAPHPPPAAPSFLDNFLADTVQPVVRDLAAMALGMLTTPPPPPEPTGNNPKPRF